MRAIVTTLILILVPLVSNAQGINRAGTWEWSAAGTFQQSKAVGSEGGSTLDIDSGTGIGFSVGYNFSNKLTLGFDLDYLRPDYRAVLIENELSKAPGFSVGNVHVMAGVPPIMQAMLAALIPRLRTGAKIASLTALEGAMDATIRCIVEWHATVDIETKPSTQCNIIHAEILRRIMEDETLGGLARNVIEVGNEFNIDDVNDKMLDGVIFLNILYKHAKRDPREDAF